MTRDAILDAAAQVFRTKGFHGASMADIAGAVKLQKASLYHHVNSKQEILLALLDRALELLFEQISKVAGQDLPPDEKLRLMVETYLLTMTENINLSSVLLLEHRSLEPALHARHIPNRDKFESLWREVVSQGIAQGQFSDVDAAMTARALLGIMNWTITWYRPDGPLSIKNIAAQNADLFLNGLLK